MSIFTSFKSFFVTTEADVIAFAGKVWAEVPIAQKEIVAIANWIVGEIPALTSAINAATPIVDVALGAADPTIAVKMAALNAAMGGLNSFAASAQAGTLNADAVVQGYSALKAASSAAANVAATAAHVIAVTPASNPSTAQGK